MRILIAPNAFKGTLTAQEAAKAMARGLKRELPHAELIKCPVADGGDGFAEVLGARLNARWIRRRVHDPVGKIITASFALSSGSSTAIIELARASGLALLKHPDPLGASTGGTGELIAAALDLGATRVLIGIGGSASTDGGTGLARALGARFLDHRGEELPTGGAALSHLARIDLSGLDPRLKAARLQVACDVTNPLHGRRGAAFTFAPQKGASLAQVRQLDAGLRQLARIIRRDLGMKVQSIAGAGAAGGTGAGLAAFCGAELTGGFDLVAQTLGIAKLIRSCDLVITGEGRLDRTTAHNKAPIGILRLARQAGIPALALGGSFGPGARGLGFDAIFQAAPPANGRAGRPAERLSLAAMEIARWIQTHLPARRAATPQRSRQRTHDNGAGSA